MKKLIVSAAIIVAASAALFILNKYVSNLKINNMLEEIVADMPLENDPKIGASSYNFFTKTSVVESLEFSFKDGARLKIEKLSDNGTLMLTKLFYERDNASFKVDQLALSGLALKDLRKIRWSTPNTFAPLGVWGIDYTGIDARAVAFSKGRFELTAPQILISREGDAQLISAPVALILMNGALLTHLTDIKGQKLKQEGGDFSEEYNLKNATGELSFAYSFKEDGTLANYTIKYRDISFFSTLAEFYSFLSGLPAMDAKAKIAEMVIKAFGESSSDSALIENSLLTEGFEANFDSETGLEIIKPRGLKSLRGSENYEGGTDGIEGEQGEDEGGEW